MNDEALLTMLKANLEKRNSANDGYLSQLIEVAKNAITREGITLTVTDGEYGTEDANLIVMYAAYLYRNRMRNGEGYETTALYPQGMPYMLRLALNNRIMQEKMSS